MPYLDPLRVESCETPAFALAKKKSRGARGRGLRYEQSVHRHLKALYGEFFRAGPWFKYWVPSFTKPLWAQPDGLLFDFYKQQCVIIEIKYNHTPDAYFQMFDKYVPLVDMFLNKPTRHWTLCCCEVVYWYDKMVAYPKEITLHRHIHETRSGEVGVHICRPEK